MRAQHTLTDNCPVCAADREIRTRRLSTAIGLTSVAIALILVATGYVIFFTYMPGGVLLFSLCFGWWATRVGRRIAYRIHDR